MAVKSKIENINSQAMHNGNSEENIKVNKPENKSLMKHKCQREIPAIPFEKQKESSTAE